MADWVKGVDISNWQRFTPQAAQALAADGVQLVIVRASHENQQLIDIARVQMQRVVNEGMQLHAYGWAYFTEDEVQTAQRWRQLYEDFPIGRFWIDCEETRYVGAPSHNVDWLQSALSVVGKQWPTGIYTGPWWWVPYMGNSSNFSNLPLWDANYSGVPELEPAALYGGWARRAIHQYTGNGSLAGISPLDLDAVDPALLGEEADMGQIEDLTNKLGYLQGDVADALQNALESAVVARNKADRQGAFDALQAAIATLRRGG